MLVEERFICKRIPSLYQRNKQEDHHQRLRVKALSAIKGTDTTLSAFLFFFPREFFYCCKRILPD